MAGSGPKWTIGGPPRRGSDGGPLRGIGGAGGEPSPAVFAVAGLAIALLLIIGWGVMTCFHTVQPEGRSVVKRFGKVVDVRDPGLHFKIPYGVDRAYFVPTERVLKQEFGFRTADGRDRTEYQKTQQHAGESLMLTGDLNVIDVEWVVQYRISDPVLYLHQVREPSRTIRDVSEAVMRRIVGNRLGSDVLTVARVEIAQLARDELQEALSQYEMGVRIGTIELQDVTPPDRVKPAFNEVNEAQQQRERFINEAERERGRILPRAEGDARRILEEAEADAARRVNRAKGEAGRFTALLEQYRLDKDTTRRRLYLEMIDEVLPKAGRIFIVEGGQTAPIPLLNLDGGPAIGGGQTGGQR